MTPATSILFSFLCAVASIACSRKALAVASAPSAVTKVDLAVVAAAASPDLLTLTGTIVADQRAEVTADTQGKVLAVLVQRGQHVTRGQPVLRLDLPAA